MRAAAWGRYSSQASRSAAHKSTYRDGQRPWRLEELHFGVAGNGFPGTAAGIAVTTFAGRLTLEYLYGDPWLRPERALGILDRAIARLITY